MGVPREPVVAARYNRRGVDHAGLREHISARITDALLPDALVHVWRSPGNGDMCHACDESIRPGQTVIHGRAADQSLWRFHLTCFSFWDQECVDRWVGPRRETLERRCAACGSLVIAAVGRVEATAGAVRSRYRCEECGDEFWYVRPSIS